MKLHVGCGSVYLTDCWVNVDVRAPKTFLARERPDLVKQWGTTEDKYYSKHEDKNQDSLRAAPLDQEYVCDEYGSFFDLPGSSWTVTEILARHSFEHLSITEARRALDEMDKKMAPNGVLRLDVPDHEETLKLYKETGDQFYVRHLLGPRRNEFGYHCMGYSRDRLIKLVEDHGFLYEGEEPNIHFYPAFCLRFRKPGSRLAWQYALKDAKIEDSWNVLEVGPGRNPWPRANVYMDISANHLADIQPRSGKGFINSSIELTNNQFPDKSFDYLFCAHTLEHLEKPEVACKEISRLAKAGTIIVPSVFKESIFNWEETDHRWWCLPPVSEGGPLRFIRRNEDYLKNLIDVEVTRTLGRLIRTGPNKIDEEQRHLRKWFYRTEPYLDLIYTWKDELKIQVIQ